VQNILDNRNTSSPLPTGQSVSFLDAYNHPHLTSVERDVLHSYLHRTFRGSAMKSITLYGVNIGNSRIEDVKRQY